MNSSYNASINSQSPARARLAALFDEGSFAEIGTYVCRSTDIKSPAGVICGYGAINGRLAFAFAEDRARMRGAFDKAGSEKILALYDMARRNGAPVFEIYDSDGLFIREGVRALAAVGSTLARARTLHGVVPRVALVPGNCGGTMAALAASADFLLSCRGEGEIYAVSPFLTGRKPAPADKGISDLELADEDALFAAARELMGYIPSNAADGAVQTADADLVGAPDASGLAGTELIAALADGGKYLRLDGAYAPGLAAGFGVFGGVSCAFLASVPTADDGALSVPALRAAEKLVRFADAFSIPLLSFVDCPGFSGEGDDAELIRAAADLSAALAEAKNPRVSVVTGRAYGPAFILLASRTLGSDVTYALPDAQVSALSPEASVAFVENDRVGRDGSRAELVDEWRVRRADPEDGAICGEIDDIVSPVDLRPRVLSAVQMLLGKSRKL